MPASGADELDVIGIGALNSDFIGHTRALERWFERKIEAQPDRFDWGRETTATEEEVKDLLAHWRQEFEPALNGGSSYNVIEALASLDLGLRLGFLGVGGRTWATTQPRARLESLGVETLLRRSSAGMGICVSYVHPRGEGRTLATWPGGNREMAQWMRERPEEVTDFLARAHLIHLTSFLDEETPAALAELLGAFLDEHPHVRLAFDPGHGWVTDRPPGVDDLLAMAHFVLLNEREFHALAADTTGGGRTPTEDFRRFDQVVEEALRTCGRARALIVVKRYGGDGISVHRQVDGEPRTFEIESPEKLRSEEIVDDTGAGDVFAAGFLAALASWRMTGAVGARLGMALANGHLQLRGKDAYPRFAAVARAFESGHFTVSSEADPQSVMVVYGHDEDLRLDTFAFLQSVGLRPMEWQTLLTLPRDRAPYTGRAVMQAIEHAQAVVVLFTPDDEVRPDAGVGVPYLQARPNVFFECGLALARKPEQTIIADWGEPFPASDIFGRHVVHLERGEAALRDLANRLERAGCPVDLSGEDWLRCRLGQWTQGRRRSS